MFHRKKVNCCCLLNIFFLSHSHLYWNHHVKKRKPIEHTLNMTMILFGDTPKVIVKRKPTRKKKIQKKINQKWEKSSETKTRFIISDLQGTNNNTTTLNWVANIGKLLLSTLFLLFFIFCVVCVLFFLPLFFIQKSSSVFHCSYISIFP